MRKLWAAERATPQDRLGGELNPIEYVWSYLKLNPLANLAFFDLDQPTTTARRHRWSLQCKPDLLRSFLRHSPLPFCLK